MSSPHLISTLMSLDFSNFQFTIQATTLAQTHVQQEIVSPHPLSQTLILI